MKAGASSDSNSNTPQYNHTPFSKFFGTALGALGEQTFFHPIDTIAKTAMAKKQPVLPWMRDLFAEKGPLGATQQLYRAFMLGYAKKAPLRIYKYGVQDEVAARLKVQYGDEAASRLGPYGHVAIQTVAGGLTGVFEPVFFQWIDTLQVRKQVLGEPISLESASKLGIRGLYQGAIVTGVGRNALGAAGLFGGSELANQLMDNQDHHSNLKNLAAKWFGAFASLVASQPGDVIKTTMQVEQTGFMTAMSRVSWRQMFTSGLGPRLVMSGKVGTGFLFIEKSMNLAKKWFGEEVKSEAQCVDVSALLETKPGVLSQFKTPDKMESECQATDEVEQELSDKMEKMKISKKRV
ncbi:MAG: hypothetical protein AB7I18_01650 [Candidatus Berkiella sp.]